MIETINPATEEIIARYQTMTPAEVNSIIESVHQTGRACTDTSVKSRKKCILNVAAVLRKHQDQYAQLITTEMGKPIRQAMLEIEKCARLCEYYANVGEQFLQPEYIKTQFYKSYRSFHPIGIVFAIMPWNFPFWQVMRFAIPNLMVGNAALLKHAPNTTGVALAIERIFVEAQFPPDLFRSLVIDIDLVSSVIHHPSVAGVTLTGSQRAGKSVAQEAGAALKKVVLELGGSDPYVILEDANLDLAADQCVTSRMNNAGQVCIAAKRMIVVEKVKKAFEEKVLAKMKAYQFGDPLNPATLLGPMARNDLRLTLHEQVLRCQASGARCLMGGEMPTGKGYYYPATLLTEVNLHSPAFKEEIFGPVACITGAKDNAEALSLANATEYGLSGAVFTQNLTLGEQIANQGIIAGTCAVNTLVASDPSLPFGGAKLSGFGRELSLEGMREFVNIKTIVVANEKT